MLAAADGPISDHSLGGQILGQNWRLLTDEQRRRANAASYLEFDVDDDWPVDALVWARVRPVHWSGMDLRIVIRGAADGQVIYEDLHEGFNPIVRSGPNYAWLTWGDDRVPLLPAHDDAMLQIEISEYTGSWSEPDTERAVRTYTTPLPTRAVGRIEDRVRRVSDDAVAAALRDGLRPEVHDQHGDSVWIKSHPDAALEALEAAEIEYLAVQYELRDGGTVVASAPAWWSVATSRRSPDLHGLHAWKDETNRLWLWTERDQPEFRNAELTLVVRGDPEVGLRCGPSPVIWDGVVEVPLPRGDPTRFRPRDRRVFQPEGEVSGDEGAGPD